MMILLYKELCTVRLDRTPLRVYRDLSTRVFSNRQPTSSGDTVVIARRRSSSARLYCCFYDIVVIISVFGTRKLQDMFTGIQFATTS